MRGAACTVDVTKELEATGFVSHKYYDGRASTLVDTTGSPGRSGHLQFVPGRRLPPHLQRAGEEDAVEETVYGGTCGTSGPHGASVPPRRTWASATRSCATRPLQPVRVPGQENTTWRGLEPALPQPRGSVKRRAQRDGGSAAVTGLSSHWTNGSRSPCSTAITHAITTASVAFSEGNTPWNERASTQGLNYVPRANGPSTRTWTSSSSRGCASRPMPASRGYDWLLQTTWTPNKKVQVYVRARFSNRATREGSTGVSPLVDVEQRNYRFSASFQGERAVTLRTRIERVDYQRGTDPVEHGFLIYQDASTARCAVPWSSPVALGHVRVGHLQRASMRTERRDRPVLHPPYGRGLRYYAMVRYTPGAPRGRSGCATARGSQRDRTAPAAGSTVNGPRKAM